MSKPTRLLCGQWLCLGVLFAIVLTVYHPLFHGEAIVERDVLRWLLPARWVLRDALVHHRLPLWNPYQGIGFPTLSDPLYGPFYPPTLLSLHRPLVGSTMLFLLAHTLSGGLGSFFLARRLGSSLYGALIAALSWSLSGYIAAEWTTGIRLLSSSYFSWSALAWLSLSRACRENSPGYYLRASIAAVPSALVFLTGEVFLAPIVSVFGFIVSLSELKPKNPPTLARYARASLLAISITALSAGVSVIPAAAMLSSTARSDPFRPALANALSLFPARVIELFAPGCIGRAHMLITDEAHRYTHGKLMNYSIYLGAAPIALCLCAPFKQRITRALGLLALGFLLLSLGSNTPLLPLLRFFVRPLAYMRAPEKFLACVVPLVCALCALGASRLTRPGPLPWRRLVAFAALLGTYAALSSVLYSQPIAPFIFVNCLRSTVVVLGLLAIVTFCRSRPALMGALLTLTVTLDLAQHLNTFHVYRHSHAVTRRPLSLPSAQVRPSAHAAAPLRIYRNDSVTRALWRTELNPDRNFMVDSLLDNTSVLSGVAILPGYDAAMPPFLTTLLDTRRRDALLLLSVDYALMSAPSPDPDARRQGFETVSAPFPGVRLYRVENTLPRVFLAGSVARLPAPELERHLLDSDTVSGRVALVSDPSPVPASQPAARTHCSFEAYAPGSITARCFASQPALAVFVEQYTLGWTALVDQRPAPVYQTNKLMLGVPLSPGRHRIHLQYASPGLYLGASLSLLAWVIITLGAVVLYARRAPITAAQNTG